MFTACAAAFLLLPSAFAAPQVVQKPGLTLPLPDRQDVNRNAVKRLFTTSYSAYLSVLYQSCRTLGRSLLKKRYPYSSHARNHDNLLPVSNGKLIICGDIHLGSWMITISKDFRTPVMVGVRHLPVALYLY